MAAEYSQSNIDFSLTKQPSIEVLPRLAVVSSEANDTEVTNFLLQDSTLTEIEAKAVILDLANRAHKTFRIAFSTANSNQRINRECRTRTTFTYELFRKLGMLGNQADTNEEFLKQYQEAELAQQSLTVTERSLLMDNYETHPAHQAIDLLGNLMGQSHETVVPLRRTILVLLAKNDIPSAVMPNL